MKPVHISIEDPSPGLGVFEGDLKYGRRHGNDRKRGDYTANRADNFVASNKPISPLILQSPRDPNVWSRDARLKEIPRTIKNPSSLMDELLLASVQHPNGLAACLTKLKLGNSLSKSGG